MLRLALKKTLQSTQHISSCSPSQHCPRSASGGQASSLLVPHRSFRSFNRSRTPAASAAYCSRGTPTHRTLTLSRPHGSQSPSGFSWQRRLLLPSRVAQHGQVTSSIDGQRENMFSGVNCFHCAPMATSARKEEGRRVDVLSEDDEKMRSNLREVFLTAVGSVIPRPMLEKVLDFNPTLNTLTVDERTYSIQRNVFVVGFGKAVLGMARVLEDLLGQHIIKGILSIPAGARADFEKAGKKDMLLSPGSKFCVQEGAVNNLPDNNAFRAARDIHKMVSNLTSKDIVIVLMSGGGSSLLPYPVEPLNMDDIVNTARELFSHGATIADVNTVRKHLEVLKGGGLAKAAMPAQVISLIISDVIGDPLDLISSGPTVRQTYSPLRCLDVIDRLTARSSIPERVMTLLETRRSQLIRKSKLTTDPRGGVTGSADDKKMDWSRVHNVLVGTNAIACKAAAQCAEQLGFVSLILSHDLCGEAREVGKMLAKLAVYIVACYHPRAATTTNPELVMLELEIASLGIKKDRLNEIATKAARAYNSKKPMCLVAGGETTVTLTGSGKGGRSQEMVLSAGIQLQKGFKVFKDRKRNAEVFFLSAGTDGQDGPTDAAGAIVDENFMVDALGQGLDPEAFLEASDSYNLWSQFAHARDLVVTGFTGTNVMDIQLLLVKC